MSISAELSNFWSANNDIVCASAYVGLFAFCCTETFHRWLNKYEDMQFEAENGYDHLKVNGNNKNSTYKSPSP